MRIAFVDFNTCASYACGKCSARLACAKKAITKLDQDEPAYIELSLCNGCGECISACLYSAIDVREM